MSEYLKIPREIPHEFARWATGWAGIPGGNPAGDLWFCGIEHGGGHLTFEFRRDLEYWTQQGTPCWDADFKDKYSDYKTWRFNQNQAKIACGYFTDGKEDWRHCLKDEFYTENSQTFGMNLYPLNFKDTNDDRWTSEHFLRTGFPSKTEYKAWCSQHRFPKLRKLVQSHGPKALVCTGRGFKRAYLIAFADNEELIFDEERSEEQREIHRITEGELKGVEWTSINGGLTLMVITPFLGRGQVSNASLQELGRFLKKKVNTGH